MKTFSNNEAYAKGLLASFVIMMIPQMAHVSSNAKTILYATCYLLSILSMLVCLKKYELFISRYRMLALVCYITIVSISLVYDIAESKFVEPNDFFDIFIKLASFIIYYLITPKNLSIKDMRFFFLGVTTITVVACIYNLAINFNSMMHVTSIVNSYSANFMSFFANRNTFAMYLFAGIFCTIIALKQNETKRRYLEIALVLELLNLLFTMSRGSILATAIVLAPSLYKYLKRHKCMMFIAITSMTICALVILGNPEIRDIIIKLFIRPDAGTSGRVALWETGLAIAKEKNILFGTGYYTALKTAGISQFHSLFVDTIVDMGIFGLVLKLGIFICIYAKLSKNGNENDIRDVYKWGFCALIFLSAFESVNILALGSTEMLYTILFLSVPSVLSQKNQSRTTRDFRIRHQLEPSFRELPLKAEKAYV